MNDVLAAAAKMLLACPEPATQAAARVLHQLAHAPDPVAAANAAVAAASLADSPTLDPTQEPEAAPRVPTEPGVGLIASGPTTEADQTPHDIKESVSEDPRDEVWTAVAVPGLAALGDLDADVTWDEPSDDATVTDDGPLGLDLPENRPVCLTALVPNCDDPQEATSAVEALLPALAQQCGAYDCAEATVTEAGVTVELTAVGDSEGWMTALPAGTSIFRGQLPRKDGEQQVRIVIAGPLDPDNPPLQIDDAVNDAVAAVAAELGITVENPETIVLTISRDDGHPLTEAELTAPLDLAVANLSAEIGQLQVVGSVVDDDPSIRHVELRAAGGGPLDARGLSVGMIGFTGKLPFPGVGMVTVTAHTPAA